MKPEFIPRITKWVDEMNRTAFYAILSGFEVGDVPGVGTFYDFFKRLWASSEKHLRSQRRKRKSKPKKGKKKGEKAPTATPGRVARLVNWMMRHAAKKTDLPADRLFHFFQENIVSVSSRLGLLGDCSALSASGDGTPIVTAAYSRSKSTCDCRAQGLAECNHPRIYPSPTVTPACGCSTAKYGHTFSRKPRMIHDCFRKHHATPKDGSSFTSAALRSSVPTNERRWTTVSKPVGIAQP